MIDWNSELISIRYSYGSIYNRRPEELYGMGTESAIVSGTGSPKAFLDSLVKNSSIKHQSDVQYFIGEELGWQNKEWTSYIGQPKFYLVDIKYEELTDEEATQEREKFREFLIRHKHTDQKLWAKVGEPHEPEKIDTASQA